MHIELVCLLYTIHNLCKSPQSFHMKRDISVSHYLVSIFGWVIQVVSTLSSSVSVYGYMKSTLKIGTRGRVFTEWTSGDKKPCLTLNIQNSIFLTGDWYLKNWDISQKSRMFYQFLVSSQHIETLLWRWWRLVSEFEALSSWLVDSAGKTTSRCIRGLQTMRRAAL